MSVARGQPGAVLFRRRYTLDAQSGPSLEYTYHGTENGIVGYAAGLGPHLRHTIENEGPKWILVVLYGTTEIEGTPEGPQVEERRHWNKVTRSIYNASRYASLDFADIRTVKDFIEIGAGKLPDVSTPTAWSVLQDELFALVKAGVESTVVYQPVISITGIASASYAWPFQFQDYGKIFSTLNMITDAELTSGWVSGLPNDAAPSSSFKYGWLKGPPDLSTCGEGRTQLVQEYEYGLWPVGPYTFA